MKIAVCDDDYLQHNRIISLIERYDGPLSHDIYVYKSGEHLLEAYHSGKQFDVIFLDIRMGTLDGVETLKRIRIQDDNVRVIFVTSLIEYAIEGYSHHVFDFLLKPITEERFNKVFLRVKKSMEVLEMKRYMVETRFEKIGIFYDDILYLESQNRKMIVYTEKEAYEHYRKISEDEELLLEKGFVRCHRSFLVNVKHIKRVQNNEVSMKNGTRVPISKGKYQEVYDKFTKYLVGDLYE